MTTEEKIAELTDMMDLEEGELTLDSVLTDFEEWDSLSKLSLIAMAKQDFGKTLDTKTLEGFGTVRDICEYLN